MSEDGLKSPAVLLLGEGVDEVVLLEVSSERLAPLLALEEVLLKVQHLSLQSQKSASNNATD